jgi:hypothetical protein
MSWAVRAACIGDMRISYKAPVLKRENNRTLGKPRPKYMIILKRTLYK